MKLEEIINIKEGELPLQDIKLDGGFTSIFRNIAVIGDSLSSGEFETFQGGVHQWLDIFEHSWGQYIARMTGAKVYNFSRGGMGCKNYITSFGEEIDAFSLDKKCEAYIIALGVNDMFTENVKIELGEVDDLENNVDSMSRYYQEIILKYKSISPKARFFFVTLPNEPDDEGEKLEKKLKHRELMLAFAKKYEFSYCIDLYKYGPKYDQEFKQKFYMHDHLNPMGYRLTALLISSYIDYIIRSDYNSFKQVGLINRPWYDDKLDK